MAQTRRTAGAGTRRRSEAAETSRAARGRQESEHSAPNLDPTAQGHDRSAHTHDHTSQSSASSARGIHPQGGTAESADVEQLQQMASEMAPQLGAAAVAAIATAVVLPEFLPAVLVGAGATLAPRLLPGLSYMFRPVMKTMMRAGYAAYSTVQHFAAEAGEQMQDVIAEVQAEQRSHGARRPHAGSRQSTETGAPAH